MIEIEIPGAPPLLLNARLHWTKAHKQRALWKHWVKLALKGQVPSEPYDRAFVEYTRCCGTREPDHDNLISGFKWIQDGLVEAGVLADDRRENVESVYAWEPAGLKTKRIRVRVVPILS